ncbi:hypothetical protein [Sulfurimonas sp. HSL3-7]|uniref:hypothetical protein n=1 Tax=Sulfonitrofixus jiaomeiensis TaxID=3131938 RepID=UPI0031FA185B
MRTTVIKVCDFCPVGASFSATAASESKRAFARLVCQNGVMVSSEGACNAYYRYAGVQA